jgi:hypothetical protein
MELKTKITFEEHKEFGRLCKLLNHKLVSEEVRIFNEQKTKKLGREKTIHYTKAVEALSVLRDHLEEIMFSDYPKESTTHIYYGER